MPQGVEIQNVGDCELWQMLKMKATNVIMNFKEELIDVYHATSELINLIWAWAVGPNRKVAIREVALKYQNIYKLMIHNVDTTYNLI